MASSPISIKVRGSFKNTESFLNRAKHEKYLETLDSIAKEGLTALMEATPKDTGLTALSWSYEIRSTKDSYSIVWNNSNRAGGPKGPPVVILLYYGHATGTGGYVQGRDFISPVMEPIFDKMAAKAWKELTKK